MALVPDAGRGAFARPGDVERRNGMFPQPLDDGLPCLGIIRIDNEAGLVVLIGELSRQGGPPGEHSGNDDQRAIGISNIGFGALGVFGAGGFAERIFFVDHPVLGASSLGAETATGEIQLQRRIKGGAIHAGLTPGDDFPESGGFCFRHWK